VIYGHVNTVCAVCCERGIFFLLHMNCSWLVYWLCFFLLFYVFLCICVLVLYLLVVRAASIDGCLCLSGSLPLLSVCLCLLCFEANKCDDDADVNVMPSNITLKMISTIFDTSP